MMRYLLSIGALVVLVAGAFADLHHNGGNLVKGLRNGKHLIHTTAHGHKVHAHLKGGKVRTITVNRKNRSVAVRKFRSTRRLHADAGLPLHSGIVNASADLSIGSNAEFTTSSMIVWVGFGFYNQATSQWVVFWFPINMVAGGDAGATDLDNSAAVPPPDDNSPTDIPLSDVAG